MAARKSSFLKYLKFDPGLKKTLVAKYLENPRLVFLLLIGILTFGISAFLSLPRNLNPEVNIPIVLVSTILPGAGPADVESLVTIPLESAINSVEDVKNVTSTSAENASIITIEFESGVDADRARDDIASAVDSITDLPEDALSPNVLKLDFENTPVWTFVLTGATDDGSLFKFAKSLQERLENLSEIDNVEISGLETTEIQITINPQASVSYGVNSFQLSQVITNSLRSFPAGTLRTDNSTFSLTIDPQVTTVDDIRNLPINLSGNVLTISDIADVGERPKPNQNQSYVATSARPTQKAVTFSVFRSANTNIDDAVAASEKSVDESMEELGNGQFEAITLVNTSEEIDHQFNDLTRDFLITVFLVVAVLFIFLGPRQALISSLSAPLSFLITFVAMQMTGISLNFLSLFSLILSLGLLVDDTVVVISAMSSYYRARRFTPVEAGLLVWRDFLAPVFTTTLTTVWAFLPLLLAAGIIGEFIKSIPIVVSTALTASFLVGMFVTLPLMVILLKPEIPARVVSLLRILAVIVFVVLTFMLIPKGNLFLVELLAFILFVFIVFTLRKEILTFSQKRFAIVSKNKFIKKIRSRNIEEGLISFERISVVYKRLIEQILASKSNRRMVTTMVIIFSIFSFLLVPLGFVKNEFFPKTDANILYVTVEYPSGTYIERAKEEALVLLEEFKNTEGVNFVSLDTGRSISQETGGAQGSQNGVLFSFNLLEEDRPDSSEIATDLRERFANYNKGKLSVVELSGGPPVGSDVQIKITGDDLAVLNTKADQVVIYLESQPGVENVSKSIKEGTAKLSFVPDAQRLSENNITVDQLGLQLRLLASGFNVEQNKFAGSDEDLDITLRFSNSSSLVESIDELVIPTQNGNLPISTLGTIKLESNPTLITREGGARTISVSGAVTGGANIAEINQKLETFANSELDLPEGYSWGTGGVNQENEESVTSILQAMLLSFLLIIVTMVIQFSSFRRAIIVMLVIPLSISGVFVIFALTSTPLSFPALIGVLALFGIVVKNSILIVDKIVENLRHKEMPFIEAISDASASRLEPIALTSLATILGLTPITLTDPLWRGLGGAIIAGLAFSGVIMLFFIPVVYYGFFNENKVSNRIR